MGSLSRYNFWLILSNSNIRTQHNWMLSSSREKLHVGKRPKGKELKSFTEIFKQLLESPRPKNVSPQWGVSPQEQHAFPRKQLQMSPGTRSGTSSSSSSCTAPRPESGAFFWKCSAILLRLSKLSGPNWLMMPGRRSCNFFVWGAPLTTQVLAIIEACALGFWNWMTVSSLNILTSSIAGIASTPSLFRVLRSL